VSEISTVTKLVLLVHKHSDTIIKGKASTQRK